MAFHSATIQYVPEVQQLIEAAKAGDELALASLFDRERPRLERMILLRLDRRLQRRIDPADVVQETYLAVREKFSQFAARGQLPFFVWVRMEATQKLVDVHRRHVGAQMRGIGQEVSLYAYADHLPAMDSGFAVQLIADLSTASEVAIRDELIAQVQNVLNLMEPMDREILVLRHFEDLSNVESALTLEISPTAASNRYVRALQRLKRVIESQPGDTGGAWS